MSRSFVNVTWNNSAMNYDGTQQQNKHMNPNGTAAIHNYSDEALELDKPKTKVPLSDRILPQAKRIRTLTEQLIELEAERKAGMDINTYSELRDVLVAKRERAEVLYKKAISVKPKSYYEEQQEKTYNCVEIPESVCDNGQDVERENLVAKHAVNIRKWLKNDLTLFVTGSIVVLVAMKIIF